MRELITDLLDAAALLLIAAGLGYQAAGWVIAGTLGSHGLNSVAIGVGLFVAGMIVLGGSWMASRRGDPR